MSALACGAGASVINGAVKNDARADAGSNRGIENLLVATRRSPTGFCESSGICVIINFDLDGMQFLHGFSQRKVAPTGDVWRIENDAGSWIERPGSTDADSGDLTATVGDYFGNGRKHGLQSISSGRSGYHGDARLRGNFSDPIHQSCGNFGAADVHAHEQTLLGRDLIHRIQFIA